VTVDTSAPAGTVILSLLHDATPVRAARHFTRTHCAAWSLGRGACEDATLVASELVTNAILHARSAMALRLVHEPHRLRVEVEDEDSRRPVIPAPDGDATGGRGLGLVSALAREWGVDATRCGKVVWAELDAG